MALFRKKAPHSALGIAFLEQSRTASKRALIARCKAISMDDNSFRTIASRSTNEFLLHWQYASCWLAQALQAGERATIAATAGGVLFDLDPASAPLAALQTEILVAGLVDREIGIRQVADAVIIRNFPELEIERENSSWGLAGFEMASSLRFLDMLLKEFKPMEDESTLPAKRPNRICDGDEAIKSFIGESSPPTSRSRIEPERPVRGAQIKEGADASGFGLDLSDPILCRNIPDEYHYISRLRDVYGYKLDAKRLGSFASEEFDHPVDGWMLKLRNGSQKKIFVYPYADEESDKAPEGLILLGN